MFLRDKDWGASCKDKLFFPPITILTLADAAREQRVSAQAKPISQVVKDFEQSLENLRPSSV
jgi:hypothetical protein